MLKKRLEIELDRLILDPGEGITAWKGQIWNELYAQIIGPQESPYSEGIFQLHLIIPDRYPFEPPHVRFITPVYHPNIDSDGRICLDTLKMQPQGSWSPSISINTLLSTIRVLLAYPNADDGLVPQITEQYKRDLNGFKSSAREHTLKHAQQTIASIPKSSQIIEILPLQQISSPTKTTTIATKNETLETKNEDELELKLESSSENGSDEEYDDIDSNNGDEIDNDNDEVDDRNYNIQDYNSNHHKRSNNLNNIQNIQDKKLKLI